MNFDRNTIIGFIVLAVLFVGYFFYTTKEQQAFQREKAHQDSIALAHQPKPNPVQQRRDSLAADSMQRVSTAGGFGTAINGTEQLSQVATNLLKITFSNKGGQPKAVELLHFKGPDGANVNLASSPFDKITYPINTGANKTADVASFYFSGGQVTANGGVQTISYTLQSPDGGSIVHQYIVKPDQYWVDFNVIINGVPQLLTGNLLNLTWQYKAAQLQKDLAYEKQQSHISYREDGDYDDEATLRSGNHTFDGAVNWVGIKQQFFNTTLIAKNNFTSGNIVWNAPTDTVDHTVVQSIAQLKLQLPAAATANVPLAFYYGPTDYKILKQYNNEMSSMVNLGSGMFSFVKYLNRWVIIPVFDLFRKLTSNFGIVILLLTLFIRLIISPLSYTSYLSSAKMKVLRPEIDKLKEKYGADQQAISMEQMKLFREAGVNPLGGCIPALIQLPIFFALYSFFNSNVALRGASFLWAKDLSQSDSIAHLPFAIPFYGDHVSLFTITAVITSFAISMYSLSSTPDQGNPVLKYMPYFFPIVLLFIFNKLPSGLTWYYTVSNIITLALQFVIQNYIINHDKILANMEAARKKPKTKSKWAERFEQMQEQQKKVQDAQRRNRS